MIHYTNWSLKGHFCGPIAIARLTGIHPLILEGKVGRKITGMWNNEILTWVDKKNHVIKVLHRFTPMYIKEMRDREGTYLVFLRRHVLVLEDGLVYDTRYLGTPVMELKKYSRSKIECLYRIKPHGKYKGKYL